MSQTNDNPKKRQALLKQLILQLHEGDSVQQVRGRLIHLLKSIPYNEVVQVEQQLIAEGLPETEILHFCDIHTAVLNGRIDTSQAKTVPSGHPVDIFKQENKEIEKKIKSIKALLEGIAALKEDDLNAYILQLRSLFNELSDIDKHYLRKEYLLFPFMEKAGISGPPKVMWAKHDEIRAMLKAAHETFRQQLTQEELEQSIIPLVLQPVVDAIESMIMKEEKILFPMCLDTLTDENWLQINEETPIYGFCLYDPQTAWEPVVIKEGPQALAPAVFVNAEAIRLSSGSFGMVELEALFLALPVDITFVDKNDKVKFFSHSPKRVFERNRSIIGRDVRMCHPPQSVHIVEDILTHFKMGKENKAVFWISNYKGRFIHIEYTALRSPDNEYLGVIEVTQDITALRKLEGDKRLLSYTDEDHGH